MGGKHVGRRRGAPGLRRRDDKLAECMKKQVGWLNANVFDNGILYKEVEKEAFGLSIGDIHDICDKLRDYDKTERVNNPTAWLCNAFGKRRRWMENNGKTDTHTDSGRLDRRSGKNTNDRT